MCFVSRIWIRLHGSVLFVYAAPKKNKMKSVFWARYRANVAGGLYSVVKMILIIPPPIP